MRYKFREWVYSPAPMRAGRPDNLPAMNVYPDLRWNPDYNALPIIGYSMPSAYPIAAGVGTPFAPPGIGTILPSEILLAASRANTDRMTNVGLQQWLLGRELAARNAGTGKKGS